MERDGLRHATLPKTHHIVVPQRSPRLWDRKQNKKQKISIVIVELTLFLHQQYFFVFDNEVGAYGHAYSVLSSDGSRETQ